MTLKELIKHYEKKAKKMKNDADTIFDPMDSSEALYDYSVLKNIIYDLKNVKKIK